MLLLPVAATGAAVEPPAAGSSPPHDPEPLFATSTLLDRIGRVVAPVMINGTGPYRLIVDTGANSSALSQELVARLGLIVELNDTILLNSVTGSTRVPVVRIAELRTGAVRMTDLRVPVLLTAVAGDTDGILGVDGFAGRRMEIDFRNDTVRLVDASRPFRPRGHLILRSRVRFGGLIVVDAHVGRLPIKAVIDTGADRSIGNILLQRKLGLLNSASRPEQDAIVMGATEGTMRGQALRTPAIQMGSVRLHDLEVTFADLPVFSLWNLNQTPALVLGMDVLGTTSEIVVDYRRSQIFMKP